MSRSLDTLRLPAAERLVGTLLERIERGDYRPGEWLPTERAMASEFRADRSTIRAALAALADKQVIVREAGRRPVVATGATFSMRKDSVMPQTDLRTLAVVIPQPPQYPASPAVQRGALSVLRQKEAPYSLLVFDNEGETWAETVRLEREALEAIKRRGVAGVVLWHQGGEETLPEIRCLQQEGIAVVLVDRCDPGLSCDFVGIDNAGAAWDAVSYLLDLGHRRVMHLTMGGETSTVRERERGYHEAMSSRGIRSEPDWVLRLSGYDLQQQAAEAADHFLSQAEPPTAIFVMQDALAYALISELTNRHIRVPDQISVMGFDDVDRHSPRPSTLSTVHQPFVRMGQKAMELLLKRLAVSPTVPDTFQHILLPAPLVLRSSCLPWTAETRSSTCEGPFSPTNQSGFG